MCDALFFVDLICRYPLVSGYLASVSLVNVIRFHVICFQKVEVKRSALFAEWESATDVFQYCINLLEFLVFGDLPVLYRHCFNGLVTATTAKLFQCYLSCRCQVVLLFYFCCSLYTFDMRNLSRAACVHMDHVLSGMLGRYPSVTCIYLSQKNRGPTVYE